MPVLLQKAGEWLALKLLAWVSKKASRLIREEQIREKSIKQIDKEVSDILVTGKAVKSEVRDGKKPSEDVDDAFREAIKKYNDTQFNPIG